MEKNEEILNRIEQLKEEVKRVEEEINKLYEQLASKNDVVDYIFNKLKYTTQEQFNTIIFLDNNNVVKYISRKQDSELGVLIVSSKDKKGYLLSDYRLEPNENLLEMTFYEKYDIPEDVIDKLNYVQESNIDYAVAPIFQLYYLLKKYNASFVRVKYD